ncbi:MAG: LysR family transcriptional regulator [Deltaproteobacteria bacterium]|nr:LysR family transcriptional regulator [Deltaproteobacteria bacterium]
MDRCIQIGYIRGVKQPHDLTLFELKLFVRTSRSRSLREIGRELDLRPAHVSKLIQGIEAKLRTSLFRRSATGVQLLPEALSFLRTAEEIVDLSEGLARSKTGQGPQTNQAALGIGAVSFLQNCLVGPLVPELTRGRPKLRLRLVETPLEELVSQGLNGAFEIALHTGKLQWTSSWTSKKVGYLKFRLYARGGHELPAVVDEKDVLQFPFVIPTYFINQKLVPGIDQCPVSVRHRLWGHETTTATSALQLIRKCDQLAFLPRVVASEALRRAEVKELSVKGWPEVEKEVFVSVRSDLVSQLIFDGIVKNLKDCLSW